jgi:hypothetical protein
MKTLQKKSTDELFELLLKRVSSAEIKMFLKEEGGNIPALKNYFILRFIESAPVPAEEKYESQLGSLLELNTRQPERFPGEIQRLLATAHRLRDSADFLDAYLIASSFIRHYPLLEKTATGFAALQQFLNLLSGLVESEAGFELKDRLFRFLVDELSRQAASLTIEESERWLSAILSASKEETQWLRFHELIVQLIGENRSRFGETMSERQEEQLLMMKYQLLLRSGQRAEAKQLLQANRRIKSFRLRLIGENLAQHQWNEAKELIKEGRRRESGKGNINVSAEWDELLLQIALQENDTRAIRNLSLQLFLSSEYHFRYFRLMKQHYDPAQWKQQLDRIVASIRKEKSFATSGLPAVAAIWIEEQEWEKLLQLIDKNASLDFVDRYAGELKEKFPEALLGIYRKAIRRFAEKFMGPEAYSQVAQSLKKMQSLPRSKEIVQSLLIELKVNYRQRRAFVEELNKIVL